MIAFSSEIKCTRIGVSSKKSSENGANGINKKSSVDPT
ncbi:hypothetical protein BMETH_955_1 [methanotrophic bacterial endosymbiont of Bathymodiolus sp.]|nr:hypothetical protein BMETH_955_1 [methanotrophic bacterial endosymbiont of Bathymodiolus sp.]